MCQRPVNHWKPFPQLFNISIELYGITSITFSSSYYFLFPIQQQDMGPRLPLSKRAINKDWQQLFFHTPVPHFKPCRVVEDNQIQELCRMLHLSEGKLTQECVQWDISNSTWERWDPTAKISSYQGWGESPRGAGWCAGPEPVASERMGILP